MLNSDLAKAIAGKGKKTATSSMEAAQGQAEDAKKKASGGSITKKRIGATTIVKVVTCYQLWTIERSREMANKKGKGIAIIISMMDGKKGREDEESLK